ncbi:alpha/beta hydrolase-fold protein [Corynebacterium breve]|uniref:Alpha/beta hydrolase-fold protein n=1 Tax=Corynebacterium breve TaxID=3049799 RepID=A0ABY8VJI5_9CORY|nr:alpha/beta hydrolase-fold protein [Corynebacterium breve]WIM68798.1 alpha/beta hydrolase-fold protein [Corynebacterium breve]
MKIRAVIATLILAAVTVASCGFPYDEEELESINNRFAETAAESTDDEALVTTEEDVSSSFPESETTKHAVEAGGLRRTYYVTAPKDASEGTKYPLIYAFHGMAEPAKRLQHYSRLDMAHAIVVYLDGQDQAWAPAPYATTTGEQDLAFVDAVRAELDQEYVIDNARVFATGLSNGGGFAAYLGCQRPQQFTAIATVAAAYYWKVSDECSSIPMKTLDIHGTADNVIEYEGGIRHDTAYESVPQMLDENAVRNHCSEEVSLSQVGTEGVRYKWHDCDAPLEHIRIGNGQHNWPGGAFDNTPGVVKDRTTHEILDFFGISYRE